MFYHKIKTVVKNRGFTVVMSIYLYMRMGIMGIIQEAYRVFVKSHYI